MLRMKTVKISIVAAPPAPPTTPNATSEMYICCLIRDDGDKDGDYDGKEDDCGDSYQRSILCITNAAS